MSTSVHRSFPGAVPRVVRGDDHVVREEYLDATAGIPLVLRCTAEGIDPVAWAFRQRAAVTALLHRHAAVLFRGFTIDSAQQFSRFATALCGSLAEYEERAAPRHEVAPGVFTSTEFPADQAIPLHHEMSYSHRWPSRVLFWCEVAAESGGATPIVDDRMILGRIDPRVREQFVTKRVAYVRNFGQGVDLTWQEAFQTDDRTAVEAYCSTSGISLEWLSGDRLRTKQVRQAVITHPVTGETVWFNHAHLFHVSNMPPSLADALLAAVGEEGLPRNAWYGDGTPIDRAALDHIREVYNSAAVAFPWQRGDVLLLDNILASHGRQSFTGRRSVLVAMADIVSED